MAADGVNTNPSPGSKGSNYVMGRTSEALKHGVTSEERSAWFFEEIRKSESSGYYFLWPLLISAWKRKPVI
jgi:hypothetical protein